MLVYILKSTFCLVLLLGIYHLFLEKEKMHQFNRFYLLGSILFSFIVPSFTITVAPTTIETPIVTETVSLDQFPIDTTPQTQIIETIDYTIYSIGLYILISSILLIILSKKVYTLLNKVKRNQQLDYFSATVVLLKERIVPYTFLHYIFINKHTYQTESLEEQILTHELAHVEQKHSIDVLFIEVLQNLFWFNPIFRYYKKAIQLNHEFLADDAVINSHKNISEYQQVLLNTTAQNNNIYLASNLNYSLTKKRLLMMTTPSSKTKIILKKLMIAPLIAGFIFAFAQRVEAQEKITENSPIETIEEQVFSPKGEKTNTGFINLNSKNYFFVSINSNTKYYNKEGKLVDNTGKLLSHKKANASTILPGSYITKTYFKGKTFCVFIDDKPNKRINNAINNLRQKYQNGISKKEMNEYKKLFNAGKKHNMYKQKNVQRMIVLYKSMSKQQQKSVTDIRKVIPPPPPKPQVREIQLKNPPPMDIVYTYKRLAKRIQKTPKNRKANIIYLNELYKKMNATQKKKVVKPSKIPVRIEIIEKKKKNKKSSKPQIREIKPVSIKVVEKTNNKELVEIIEEEEKVVEQHELREIEETVEETEIEVKEILEAKEEVEITELKEVGNLPAEVKATDLITEFGKTQNSKLKKIYYINNKKVSERRIKKLNPNKIKKLEIKKTNNKIGHIYITLKK